MAKSGRTKSDDSVRGHRFKKQGGQSGGPGYNEKIDGKTHARRKSK